MQKNEEILFSKYFENWIKIYKEGAIKNSTLNKYYLIKRELSILAPKLKLSDLNRDEYQKILNKYGETHQKSTTLDFHHHLKACIVDALDDGLLKKNPTRRIVIKGKESPEKKKKYLSIDELNRLISHFDLGDELNWDWFFYLIIQTGLRFSEALALTPLDIDFTNNLIHINKAWNYKDRKCQFVLTKNKSSNRAILVDKSFLVKFKKLVDNKDKNSALFGQSQERVYNFEINKKLSKLCKKSKIPVISIHGLRHTHASILLFKGVSIQSISRRLGHSSVTTTQNVYIHIINELELKDRRIIEKSLSIFNKWT